MLCLRQQALQVILMQDADAKAAAVRALPPVLQLDDNARCRLLAEPAGVPGRPARPSICITSIIESSVHLPFSGSYTCVPLMITVCAGRLTPQARVAVETST